MPAVPIIMGVLSVAVGVGGALYSGAQQKKAAAANAEIAEKESDALKQKANYDEQIHRDRVKKILSAQRALYGKSGVDMEGSPLLVMQDTAKEGEMDALAIRFGGNVAAARARSEANLYRMQGRSAQTASYWQAGSSLLAGASQTYNNWPRSTPAGG